MAFEKLNTADKTAAIEGATRHAEYILANPDVFVLPDGAGVAQQAALGGRGTPSTTRPFGYRYEAESPRAAAGDETRPRRRQEQEHDRSARSRSARGHDRQRHRAGVSDDAVKLLADEIRTGADPGRRTSRRRTSPGRGSRNGDRRWGSSSSGTARKRRRLPSSGTSQSGGTTQRGTLDRQPDRDGAVQAVQPVPAAISTTTRRAGAWLSRACRPPDLHDQVAVIDRKMAGTGIPDPCSEPDDRHRP